MNYFYSLQLLVDSWEEKLINITVKYLGTFSQITRKHSEVLTLNKGSTINDLKELLCKKYGRKFKTRINNTNTRAPVFIINGITHKSETILNNNDTIIISYPVGGG